MPFPSQSPITIDDDRSVSIIGRSADDGGRVTLKGFSDSRFFVVEGGTLYLTHLNLVNGSSPNPGTYCDPSIGDFSCTGGAILVLDDGELVVTSCDIRGRRDGHFDAYYGAGVRFFGIGIMTAAFDNVTFEGLSAFVGAAINVYKTTEVVLTVTFRHCQISHNVVVQSGIIRFAQYSVRSYFYDCQFLNNEGMSIVADVSTSPDAPTMIRSCTFRDNTPPESSIFDPYYGSTVMVLGGHDLEIWDSVFENNIGPIGSRGGALGVAAQLRATVINSTFVENVAAFGGAVDVATGASLTLISCYARANGGNPDEADYGATLHAIGGTLIVLNSTVTDSGNSKLRGTISDVGGVGYFKNEAIVIIKNSIFTNSRSIYTGGFSVITSSSLSMTDCIHRGAEVTRWLAYLFIDDSSTVTALRNLFEDLRSPTVGPVYLRSGSTGYFEDCDFIDNYNDGVGGTIFLRPGSSLVITNSRITGSSAEGKGSVAWIDATSVMRIVGSTIMNASGDAAFAIHDESGTDFGVQLDSVLVAGEVHSIILHYITLHYMPLHCIVLHIAYCILHCVALQVSPSCAYSFFISQNWEGGRPGTQSTRQPSPTCKSVRDRPHPDNLQNTKVWRAVFVRASVFATSCSRNLRPVLQRLCDRLTSSVVVSLRLSPRRSVALAQAHQATHGLAARTRGVGLVRYPFDTATLSRPADPRDRLALLVHPVVHTVTSLRHHHPLLRRVALRCGLLQLATQFGVWLTWRMISGVGSFLSCAMQPRGTWSIMSPRSSTPCRRERFKSTADAAGAGASHTRCFFHAVEYTADSRRCKNCAIYRLEVVAALTPKQFWRGDWRPGPRNVRFRYRFGLRDTMSVSLILKPQPPPFATDRSARAGRRAAREGVGSWLSDDGRFHGRRRRDGGCSDNSLDRESFRRVSTT